METFLIRALQLILSLSLLVIIHEGGHFFFARLFKIRVEKFYIFFDPWFSLFKYKPKNSDTEYGVGWLPLGGYCKISGMIDESMDTEQMKLPPQDWEFRSKPAWQRLLVMIGGVLMNFLLALFIYSMILYKWGDSYIALKDMSYGMKFNETAQKIGFQDGDILKSADGEPLERFNMDMLRSMVEAKEVTVIRNGEEKTILMPELSLLDVAKEDPIFVATFCPNVIDSVLPEGAFAKAGIQKGDSLLAVNGTSLNSWNSFMEELGKIRTQAELKEQTSASFNLVYSRAGVRDTVEISTNDKFVVGAIAAMPSYPVTTLSYGFFESFPAGVTLGVNTLKGYVNDMKYVFTKEGAKSVGGFAAIGSIFPKVWDWQRFWEMTAFLSIILAFMNILPIPALDGGRLVFLVIEAIRRKPINRQVEGGIHFAGLMLLMALMVFVMYNDIVKLI